MPGKKDKNKDLFDENTKKEIIDKLSTDEITLESLKEVME